jgi:hypothetical protein
MGVQVACHMLLETSWWGLQLFFGSHLNQRLSREVVAFQNVGNPNFGSSKTPNSNLGDLGQNDICM